ncbi:MAG: YeeE/YedE family protein [Erysipelotrichales bacterium]|nr:YeeE/YedE family protein [Erysipelotrichales bacterium]MBR3693091.1 YeeE/YedE family protein [Erysipelotrichales bacterium]
MSKKEVKRHLKNIFVLEMTPKIGTTCIAILAVIYFFFNKKVIATAMPLALTGYKFFNFLGVDMVGLFQGTSLPADIEKFFLNNSSLVMIFGFAIGSILTNLLRGEYKPSGLSKPSKVVMFMLGGFLVGFGVQGIYGANIGEVFGAISMMSLSGWIVIPFVMMGIYLSKPILQMFNK